MKKGDLYFLIFLIIFSIAMFFIIPLQIKDPDSFSILNPGPRVIPILLTIIIFICSVLLLFDFFKKKQQMKGKMNRLNINNISLLKILFMTLLIIIWIIFYSKWGYIISTIIALIGAYVIYGGRNIYAMIGLSLLFSFGTFYFFTKVLNISLAKSSLFYF